MVLHKLSQQSNSISRNVTRRVGINNKKHNFTSRSHTDRSTLFFSKHISRSAESELFISSLSAALCTSSTDVSSSCWRSLPLWNTKLRASSGSAELKKDAGADEAKESAQRENAPASLHAKATDKRNLIISQTDCSCCCCSARRSNFKWKLLNFPPFNFKTGVRTFSLIFDSEKIPSRVRRL